MPKVKIVLNEGEHVQALVEGRGYGRTFVVDYWPALGLTQWLCTCGHAPGCSHIRAVRERTGR